MAPYETDDSTDAGEVEDLRPGRRRAARYIVPVTVVGVAAATIGLVPALADSGDPNLPKVTAQQLLDKIAKSDVQQLSGTVKISTDLGLPDLGGLESSMLSGATKSGDGSSADPSAKLTELATGTHTLRVAADGPDRQKVSLLENAAEYSLIHNGKDVWGYDSKSNEVYHGTTAAGGAKSDETRATPKGLTGEALKSVDDTTSVTVDGTEHVAGRDAYKLLIKPKQSGTTVGTISVAVDAGTGLPLKFTLTPASGGAAVVDVGFTQLSLAKPAASTFDFKTPKGAKVTTEDGATKATRTTRPRSVATARRTRASARAPTSPRSSARAGTPSPPSTPAARASRPAPRPAAATSAASSARSATRSRATSARARSSPPAWSTPWSPTTARSTSARSPRARW